MMSVKAPSGLRPVALVRGSKMKGTENTPAHPGLPSHSPACSGLWDKKSKTILKPRLLLNLEVGRKLGGQYSSINVPI